MSEERRWLASRVHLEVRRWTATLTIDTPDGTDVIMFSADAAHTEHNGLFVGTTDEARAMESLPSLRLPEGGP